MLFFAQNIKYLRNRKELSQEALSTELEISRSKIAAYEDNRSQPSLETLIIFSNYFKIPIDALIRTDLTKSNDSTFIDIGNNRVLFPIMVDENNNDVIEVVTKEASAGYLQGYSDTEYVSSLPIMNLNFLPTGKHRAFPIKGDSMNPWVKDGDFVIGEYMEDPKTVRNNFCYVILTKDDGLVYKRVYTHKMDKDYLVLSSDNKTYQPYELHLSNVLELWQFRLNLCIGQYEEDDLNPVHILNLMRSVGIELKDLKERVDGLETVRN